MATTTNDIINTMDKELEDVELGNVEHQQEDVKPSAEEETQQEEGSDDDTTEERKFSWVKIALGLLLLSFIGFVIADTLTTRHVADLINSFLDWIEENPGGGVFLFIIGE